MDLRVQCLDPAIHHFGEAGEVGDFPYGGALISQQLVGSAGREELDPEGAQITGEVGDAGLVEDRKERSSD